MKETRQNDLPHGGTRSRNPRLTSIVLIAINVAVWLGILFTGRYSSRLYDLLALTPRGMCTDGQYVYELARQGCSSAGLSWVDGVASGAYWQVISSAFTHVEIVHILLNMAVLWMRGPSLEQALGRARFLAVYFVAILGSAAAVMLFSQPYSSTVGASGAIYGLMGALLVFVIRHKGDLRTILIWLGINVVATFAIPSVSWQGHLGGFVGGALIAVVMVYLPKAARRSQWPLTMAVAAIFIGIIAGMVRLLA